MKEIILFDGGMGQELVKRNHTQNDQLWSSRVLLDNYELVVDLHKEFLDAGSQVITLNSYASTPQRLKKLNLENLFEKLQKMSVKAAIKARNSNQKFKDIKIAGCLPPLEGSYRSGIKIDKNEALDTFKDIVNIQKKHVDFFICETMSSIEEALIAYEAANSSGKPIYVSFCISENNGSKLISQENLFDACTIFNSKKISALGVNCCQFEAVETAIWLVESLDSERNLKIIQDISRVTPISKTKKEMTVPIP